ncbi:tRNA (guanosine(37)-N1)-methyltransferase TrmD [Candidatus Giovannonibacteria bacterium RIFCSPHIGHO2_02_43_13]|uniref:tRNA (guanine-N(1)-)-methyltransferase n=1 Tax=Candidatus Giovannonibacteria bacterium RIFCSPHIGHO2_02_43_13 TaxID=1798330 RepID=A0A1F5WR84_9BACT|nr:MAG: tRNA (guanine-N(1)-)-methyltransferase [Parcubacteria group bacterium GW2011_GWA2_44_13]OGF74621.1 MAG: tRNA (guanosine(37)-N1)-methyltransferase TrmD [Candidatus Giovannonibacteria bacterium RIFCSPHIGHO2_12_FULL_44_42]OGF78178.1 MAG: tRNA (guanosine(37)-N1)-methyltransferase TrmD [Candidatus Giovannonibacteria bacterium RIFCSPHIGHO2_02_43_13]OGF89050.1 MAG: tRNA (guanosine(37)-N1)-methyltransferase TrmD [Candidatus Giovannonibacteria bacterium RIFCSPLOWO2_02_FULL_43_54]OGF96911.1 MAG: 
MLRFDVITIFPDVFTAYFNESILRRAREKKLIDFKIWNLRDFAKDKHRKTDDRAYGGGPGMVMKIEPLVKVLEKIITPLIPLTLRGTKKKRSDSAPLKVRGAGRVMIIFLDAGGKQFDASMAQSFSKKYKHIIFICGRYEGVDERIKKVIHASGFMLHEISVGPYVLTGGELPAMIMVDAISRHIPGVLGKNESLEEKRYGVGVPAYTRPEVFKYKHKKYAVPKVLLSGNHKNIEIWRRKNKKS